MLRETIAIQTEQDKTLPKILHNVDVDCDTNVDFEDLVEHEQKLAELREQTKLLEKALAEQKEQEIREKETEVLVAQEQERLRLRE